MPPPLLVDILLLAFSVCTCSVLFASARWRRIIMSIALLCVLGIITCLMLGSLVSVALAAMAYLLLSWPHEPGRDIAD